jgi:hypothetical protein
MNRRRLRKIDTVNGVLACGSGAADSRKIASAFMPANVSRLRRVGPVPLANTERYRNTCRK